MLAAPGGLAAKAATKAVALPPGLAAIEARLDRLEALLQRIAERVGADHQGAITNDCVASTPEQAAIIKDAIAYAPKPSP